MSSRTQNPGCATKAEKPVDGPAAQRGLAAIAIHTIRRRMNLSQAEFAALIGIKQNTLSKYECGRVKPGAPQIIKILSLGGGQHSGHPSECLPLTILLTEELGLKEISDLALIDCELERIRADEIRIKARLQALEKQQKALDKAEKQLLKTLRSGQELLAADQDLIGNSAGGQSE